MFAKALGLAVVTLAIVVAAGECTAADDSPQNRAVQPAESTGEPLPPRSTPTRPPTLVRAGDRVRATARVGGVEAVVIAIAAQNGVAQQIIRVVNPDSRRAIRVRVVAAGEVEVVNAR